MNRVFMFADETSLQAEHHIGINCSLTPGQLLFRTAREFDELRSLHSPDGMWLTIYFRQTKLQGAHLTSLSAIGEGLLRRAQRLGVKPAVRWLQNQRGDLQLVDDLNTKARDL